MSQQLTVGEAKQVIFNSLSTLVKFANKPDDSESGEDPFLDEHILWKDLFELTPANKPWLRTQTLVSIYALNPGQYRPSIASQVYYAHIDEGVNTPAGEKVRSYLIFLRANAVLGV